MKISLGITDYGYYTSKKKKINSAQKTGLFSMPSFKSITAGGNVLKAEVYEAFEKFKTRNAQPFKNLPTEEIDKITGRCYSYKSDFSGRSDYAILHKSDKYKLSAIYTNNNLNYDSVN